MATRNDVYQLFDTQSPMIHGVAPQTGNFHTYIPIASLVGNNGLGPSLDINLFYSPDMQDLIFLNWGLRLSHYLDRSLDGFRKEQATLYLSTGEAWSFYKNGFDGSPNFVMSPLASNSKNIAITRKDGTVEILEKHSATLIVPGSSYGVDVADYFLLKKLISPSGHSLTLNWEDYVQQGYRPDINLNIPRLKSINDESGVLLSIDYTNYDSITLNSIYESSKYKVFEANIAFNVFPDTPQKYSHEFQVTSGGLKKSSKNQTLDVTYYNYIRNSSVDRTFKLNNIKRDSGSSETLTYDENSGNISRHFKKSANDLPKRQFTCR
jgi:hypothetical protein